MKLTTPTVGLCALVTMQVITSSCTTLNKEPPRAKRKTALARMESLTRHIGNTVTDVSADIAPVLTAVESEVFREVNSDMPALAEELQNQMGHLSPARKPPQSAGGQDD